MKLIIVESPGKIKKIGGYLGQGWQVMASFGHIRDLPLKELGVTVPGFKPQYEVSQKSRGHVSKLRTAARNASEIYLATDRDREGEAIAWHLEQELKLKKPKRVTFNEITRDAIQAAVTHPGTIDYQLVAAQETRRVADRLVGYMVSPALSQSGAQRLSAGRVQSPAVRLVVERERAIENFKPTQFFIVRLSLHSNGVNWYADWDSQAMLPDGQRYLQDQGLIQQLCMVHQLTIDRIEKKKSKSNAPPSFTTSTLQQAASVALGLNPKKTMQLAQSLYEAGLITYHRTDSRNLSTEATTVIRNWLSANGYKNELPDTPNRWGSKAGAQEAHEAIRPTTIDKQQPGLDGNEARLYQLIWQRAVASQMCPAEYEITTIHLLSRQTINGKQQPFLAKGRVPIFLGWIKLTQKDQTEEAQEKDGEQTLPNVQQGQAITAQDVKVLDRQTKPPARYTQASLVKKLEAEGIGRPSTYASILDNIMSRGYVEESKKKLQATSVGKAVCDALTGKFQFIDLAYTKGLERQLDQIAAGKQTYDTVISALHNQLNQELQTLEEISIATGAVHTCHECGKPLNRRKGKKGFFWGCTGYPNCSTTLSDNKGKPGQRTNTNITGKKNMAGMKCSTCDKGELVKREMSKGKNSGKQYLGCTTFPTCRHFEWLN